MRVLVTNDDGIDSPGLYALARAASSLGWEVLVAAPSTEASGTGTSLASASGRSRIPLERRQVDGFEAFAVPGHPALISFIACQGGFGERPDLVLSGVNLGANTSTGILHSGTVGAALAASARGVSALAVSLDVEWDGSAPLWDTATDVARAVLPMLAEMPAATVLNLNVPNAATVRGIEWADIAPSSPYQVHFESNGDELKLRAVKTDLEPVPGTEIAFLADGYAALTPLRSVAAASTSGLPSPAWPA
ncbi:5'-nucleotidase [Lentzea waywayandensis]|uniref:5'-nucleotidase n=1 Tax=Lentzea waywayandensis TaxID=84724 RepID=A0A1I6EXU5_9PSEU|nr:5'/3'-nucleotidase SurE [Lentzea waywayandensis]SFR22495.1 5'-nucleotidase [Lentzea waywayandensis]